MSHFHLHFIFLRYNISSPYWSLDGCEIRSMVAIAMDEKERTFLSGLWLFPLASWLLLILFSSSSKTKFKKFLVSTLFLFSIEKSIRISPTTTTAPCFLKIDTWCYPFVLQPATVPFSTLDFLSFTLRTTIIYKFIIIL